MCVLGADINCPEEKNHSTPLHLAVQNNHIQVVKWGRKGGRERINEKGREKEEGKSGQEEESSAIYSSVLAVTWKQQISVNGTQTCKRLTCACVVVIPVDAVSMETVVVGVFWEQLNQRVMVWYHEDVFLLLHLSFPTRYTNGTMIKRTTATANTIPRMAPVLSPPVLRPPWSWGKRKFSYMTLVKLTTLFHSVLVKLDAQMSNDHAANHCILIPRLSPLSSLAGRAWEWGYTW